MNLRPKGAECEFDNIHEDIYGLKAQLIKEFIEAYFDPIANSSNQEDIIEARRRYPSLHKISIYLQKNDDENLSYYDLPKAFHSIGKEMRPVKLHQKRM